jgi:ribonuclease BN (tRNA processing enzyme)
MRAVTITFLGSGDTFGSGGRFQTCIHVDAKATQFLLDCGASSLIALKRCRVDLMAIDAILITHLHGDHFGGIPFFILEAHLVSKRTRPLTLAGPPGLESRVRLAMDTLFPGSAQVPQKFDLEFIELAERVPTRLGTLTVTPYHVSHASGAPPYALRVECAGKIIAYSGDTEWTDELLPAANRADLFICEAYMFDRPIRYHLDYKTLLHHRPELNCKRLVVTHMSDDMLNRISNLEIEWAEDGKQIVI